MLVSQTRYYNNSVTNIPELLILNYSAATINAYLAFSNLHDKHEYNKSIQPIDLQ